MTLDAIQSLWQKDQALDLSLPDQAIRDVPLLHSRWWGIYIEERQRLVLLKYDHDDLRRKKLDWLLGRMDEAERIALGWAPQNVRMVRQEVDAYLAVDPDLLPMAKKLAIQELKLKFVEDCIKHINNRGYLLKTYVEYLRYSQGA